MPGICNPLVPEHQEEKYGTTGKGEKYHQSDFNQKNRLKMGLEDDTFTSASRIIILKIEDKGSLGVIVDEVCEVVNLSEDQIENNNINSNHVKDTFINGIGTSGDQLISMFEINAIVDEKDNT